MRNLFFALLIFLIVFSCKEETTPNVQVIVDKAINAQGGNNIATATMNFDFRDKHYKAIRNNNEFQFEREFTDSLDVIKDVYTNTKFTRFVNNEAIVVHDTIAKKYISSINSVHYFSVLPFGLNDEAVNKTYLEDVVIKEKNYHKIKVTFTENGGGEDFEDVFVYWINTETLKVDYLAYSYSESDGKGLRFREAYNERIINGIRFVDYNNFKPKNKEVDLLDLDRLFNNNELKLLSKIENKNIKVN